MSISADDPMASFRRTARGFLWAVDIGLVIAIVALVMMAGVLVLRGYMMSDARLTRIALGWLPVIFYLAALLSARTLFSTLAREGFTFGAAVVRALSRIGVALAGGGVISLLGGSYLLVSGVRTMGGIAVLVAPGLTIAILGGALVAIARLIGHAETIRRQATSLSAELEGFV